MRNLPWKSTEITWGRKKHPSDSFLILSEEGELIQQERLPHDLILKYGDKGVWELVKQPISYSTSLITHQYQIPVVPGCTEHNSIIPKIIWDAKRHQVTYGTQVNRLHTHSLRHPEVLLWNYLEQHWWPRTHPTETGGQNRDQMYNIGDSVHGCDEVSGQMSVEA